VKIRFIHCIILIQGPWRGVERECYHSLCDDYRIVTPQNLNFLKKVADTLFESALNFFES